MFRAKNSNGSSNPPGFLGEIWLDQLQGRKWRPCVLRLFRGVLKIYGASDVSIDGRPEEVVHLSGAAWTKPLLGIEELPPAGFQLKVGFPESGQGQEGDKGSYCPKVRFLEFCASRTREATDFTDKLTREWERVYPESSSRKLKQALSVRAGWKSATRAPETSAEKDKASEPPIPIGARTIKLFGMKLRAFLVYALENGGAALLTLGPVDTDNGLRPSPTKNDCVPIDRFHQKLLEACSTGLSEKADEKILAVAAQMFYNLAGFERDAAPRAHVLLQRLSLAAVVLTLSELGANMRSLELWLNTSGKPRRLCQVCEEPLGLSQQEALAVTCLSAPLPTTFAGLADRLKWFSKSQICNAIPEVMMSERTIRAAAVVFAPIVAGSGFGDGSMHPFFLAEAAELGLWLRKRLILSEALLDPADPGAMDEIDIRILGLNDDPILDKPEIDAEAKEEEEKNDEQSKAKKKSLFKKLFLEDESKKLRGARQCFRKLLPNIKISKSKGGDVLNGGEESEKEKEDNIRNGMANQNRITPKHLKLEDMMDWIVDLMNLAKYPQEGPTRGKMGVLFAKPAPLNEETPHIAACVMDALKRGKSGGKGDLKPKEKKPEAGKGANKENEKNLAGKGKGKGKTASAAARNGSPKTGKKSVLITTPEAGKSSKELRGSVRPKSADAPKKQSVANDRKSVSPSATRASVRPGEAKKSGDSRKSQLDIKKESVSETPESKEAEEAKKKLEEEERKKKEKLLERMLKAPTFVLLELHEIEPYVHEVRFFWRPHKPAEYNDPRGKGTGKGKGNQKEEEEKKKKEEEDKKKEEDEKKKEEEKKKKEEEGNETEKNAEDEEKDEAKKKEDEEKKKKEEEAKKNEKIPILPRKKGVDNSTPAVMEDKWENACLLLEPFMDQAFAVWEERMEETKKAREEAAEKKRKAIEDRKKAEAEAEAKKKAAAQAKAKAGHIGLAGAMSAVTATRGSFMPGTKAGGAGGPADAGQRPVRGSFRPGAPGGGVGGLAGAVSQAAAPAKVRGSFRPGAPGGGIAGGLAGAVAAAAKPAEPSESGERKSLKRDGPSGPFAPKEDDEKKDEDENKT
eukprot:gnl/MRDRNA2_/MRDRNA2_88628_c0_seq1.p1 gnl/MRDRNA2_/MRDRNA2_88628_c0~~gnl/MRDRNA2_/MRDRNA2_88628_c0_seq1.p1  ORF type:complete len:1082 (+),score=331.29 gnl/MRDRNA2_/MRDRNA2_88628_c0_seq1:139-3384(+)